MNRSLVRWNSRNFAEYLLVVAPTRGKILVVKLRSPFLLIILHFILTTESHLSSGRTGNKFLMRHYYL